MKVVSSLWFNNSQGTCGIILCVDELTKVCAAYVGIASGRDEKMDTKAIMEWGNKLSPEVARRIAAHLTPKKQKKGKGGK